MWGLAFIGLLIARAVINSSLLSVHLPIGYTVASGIPDKERILTHDGMVVMDGWWQVMLKTGI